MENQSFLDKLGRRTEDTITASVAVFTDPLVNFLSVIFSGMTGPTSLVLFVLFYFGTYTDGSSSFLSFGHFVMWSLIAVPSILLRYFVSAFVSEINHPSAYGYYVDLFDLRKKLFRRCVDFLFLVIGLLELLIRFIVDLSANRLDKNNPVDDFLSQQREIEGSAGDPIPFDNAKPEQNFPENSGTEPIPPRDVKPKQTIPVKPFVVDRDLSLDPMFEAAVDVVMDAGFASTSLLQRRVVLGYARAARIMDEMEQVGIVGPFEGAKPRKVLITKQQWAERVYLPGIGVPTPVAASHAPEIDSMTGLEFEEYCAELLRRNGFTAEVTQASGDHGIDILAQKDGVSYAIQCKKYSGSVPYAAVQQAHTGRSIYNCDVAAVMTNSTFTQQAVEDAEKLRVRLWGPEELARLSKAAPTVQAAEV